jgi:trans-aconitate 2-methyltransferase
VTADFSWDAARYRRYQAERDRPFHDLVARIDAQAPARVVDLGCGDARLTSTLASRWPAARVEGVDASAQMLADAREHGRDAALQLSRGDIADLRAPAGSVDVLVSNAALQWVPGHEQLLPGLVDALTAGGWLAFQVPGNQDAPSHALMREVASRPAYQEHTARLDRRNAVRDLATYPQALLGLGCEVDAWETTYQHVLTGPDPVLEWVRGTGLRPYLAALPAELRDQFEAEYRAELARAYPNVGGRTLLPFRRLFVVAHRPG